MFSDKRIYCTEHKTTKQATRGAIWDPQTKVSRPLLIQPPKRYQERAATLYDVPHGQWIRAGALTVLRCGEAPSVAGAPPPGFVAHRNHWSNVRRGETCGYLLSVVAVPTRDADVDDDDDADEDVDAMGLTEDAHGGAGAHGDAGARDGATGAAAGSLCRNLSSNEWESVWRESGEPGHCEGSRGVGGGKRSGGDGGKGRDGGGDGGMGEAWFL
jgi:hypothetical protein